MNKMRLVKYWHCRHPAQRIGYVVTATVKKLPTNRDSAYEADGLQSGRRLMI
jgi:hypothetical protein